MNRLDKLNTPYQIERIMRDWIPRNKLIVNIDIDDDGQMITIIYKQNKDELGFITVEVGMIKNE